MTTKSILRMFGFVLIITLAFIGLNTVMSVEFSSIWKKVLTYFLTSVGLILALRWSNPKAFKLLLDI
jgi:hypothetical protein